MSVEVSKQGGRVLDPIERLSEVLFGLIMVLSFTCSISAATAGRGEVREVLIGAIGCNLAWGIVDAVMYIMTVMLERGRGLSIARSVRASRDPAQGRRLIAEALPEPLDELLDDAALEQARAKLIALPAVRDRPKFRGRDLRGAFGVFLLVFFSTFPVVVPFLVVSPVHRAMRISNAVAIVMLYLAGDQLGRYSGLGRLRTGLVMVAIGVAMVGVTMAMGG